MRMMAVALVEILTFPERDAFTLLVVNQRI
jgi:hypothetical protein